MYMLYRYYICGMNKSSLYKGCLEPILLKLLKDNGKMYGYQITQKVKELTLNELQITEGALYPLLHKLESDGILETEIEYIGNRIRKYYTLTKVGKKQSIIVAKEMDLFLQSLKNILQPTLAKS